MRKAVALLFASMVAGCQHVTAYEPMTSNGGYSEQQLSADSYKIHVTGNQTTSAGQVKLIAFLRASELTQNAGYKRFVVLSNDIIERDWFGNPLPPGKILVRRIGYGDTGIRVSSDSGDFIIRFVKPDDPAYASAFDAAEEIARLRPMLIPPNPPKVAPSSPAPPS